MDKKYFEMIYNSKIDKHIEYLKDCWLNEKTITIKDAKYFVKEFTHRDGIDYGVDICLVFKEFDLYVDDNRDFTLDELIFIQGNLGSMINRIENELNEEVEYKRKYMLKRKINTIENINNKITKLLMRY